MAKVQSIQTGEVKEVDEATQDMSDTGGFVPVDIDTPVTLIPTDGGNDTPPPSGEEDDDVFSEFNSAMSAKELSLAEKKQEEERMIREQANATFNPLIDDARITGEKREGGGRMALGSTRGLGLSTAGASYIAHIEQQTDKAVADLEQQKAAFISSGNFKAADRAEERLDRFRGEQLEILSLKNQMAQQVFMNEMASSQENRAEEAFEFDKEKFEKTFNMTKDEFNYNLGQFDRDMATQGYRKLKPSELTQFSEEQIIRVPNALTGKADIYLAPEGSPDLMFTTGTDNAGNKTTVARDKNTGQVIWESVDIGIDKARVSSGPSSTEDAPLSYEEFRSAMENETQMSQDVTGIYQEYVNAFNENLESLKTFTTNEKNLLEANGLLNASRIEQLNFLYNTEDEDEDDDIPYTKKTGV